MRKITLKKQEFARKSWRLIAVTSLAVTMAAIGCTTNRYPGNGEPTGMGSVYGPASHTSTPGYSSGTAANPPMSSSYLGVTRVNTDVLAILAAEQGFRGRVLGPVAPEGVQSIIPVATGQFISPALTANPQETVNSSISSVPSPVISSGAAGGTLFLATTGAAPAGTTAATAAATPAASTTAATAPATAATTATTSAVRSGTPGVGVTGPDGTTVAGSALFSPVLTNSTPKPTATGAAAPLIRPIVIGRSPAATTTATPKPATARSVAGTNAALVLSSPIRIETGTTGQIMVTNAKLGTK